MRSQSEHLVEVDGRTIEVTHPDRVVFPEVGLSKAELVEYHRRIGPHMLPHVAGRPLSLKRYPEGLAGSGFFQKAAPDHLPDWIRRVEVVRREGGTVTHVVADEVAALVHLVQFGTIELHPWLALADDVDHPDRIVLDLDPEEGDLDGARLAARTVRAVLEELGLDPRVMTSGSKGYHVVAAIEPALTQDEVRAATHDVARVVAGRHPDALTVQHRIARREGRTFVDYLRNGYAQTSVVPYGVRARPVAPVATPIDWEELGRIDPQDHRVDTIFRRLGQRDDPWADMRRGDLAGARTAIGQLLAEQEAG